MSKEKLDAIPDVQIDPDGVFKYILIKVSSKSGESKTIVRGDALSDYHSDVFDKTAPGIKALGLNCEALGGGRIDHSSTKKSILVYGYSMGYGQADHSVACELLKKHYPDYKSITFSNEGY
ncbi:14 kDa phosphohistidine phosphatase-like [Ptychodera flava]|uniref:14 kDa phosphohistidine phosphatase-like n=1 Tax=Ptychodera flava TaxID=63121 RepID=UPI00396A30F0